MTDCDEIKKAIEKAFKKSRVCTDTKYYGKTRILKGKYINIYILFLIQLSILEYKLIITV